MPSRCRRPTGQRGATLRCGEQRRKAPRRRNVTRRRAKCGLLPALCAVSAPKSPRRVGKGEEPGCSHSPWEGPTKQAWSRTARPVATRTLRQPCRVRRPAMRRAGDAAQARAPNSPRLRRSGSQGAAPRSPRDLRTLTRARVARRRRRARARRAERTLLGQRRRAAHAAPLCRRLDRRWRRRQRRRVDRGGGVGGAAHAAGQGADGGFPRCAVGRPGRAGAYAPGAAAGARLRHHRPHLAQADAAARGVRCAPPRRLRMPTLVCRPSRQPGAALAATPRAAARPAA